MSAERIPLGFSLYRKKRDHRAVMLWSLRLQVPLMVWHRIGYDISNDSVRRCWWQYRLMISLDRIVCGFSVRVLAAWCLP